MVEEGKDTSESQHPFNDGVLQSSDLTLLEILQSLQNESGSVSDLTLLEILQSLQNESGSVSETSDHPLNCTSTAGLLNTLASTTAVEILRKLLVFCKENPSLEQTIMDV